MKQSQRHVLFIGTERSTLERVAPMLRRAEFHVHSVPDSEMVLDVVRSTSFELLVVSYPTRDFPVEELISTIRSDGSTCRAAGLLLIADENSVEAANAFVEHGVNRAVSESWTQSRLWQVVGDLVKVQPRIALRTLVDIGVRAVVERQEDLCRTENVSISGMLLHGTHTHPPGTSFDFSFGLPGDSRVVEGMAEVVRIANPDREGLEGFGARIVTLSQPSRELLTRFIRAQLRS